MGFPPFLVIHLKYRQLKAKLAVYHFEEYFDVK
jgi:hypothetical protein